MDEQQTSALQESSESIDTLTSLQLIGNSPVFRHTLDIIKRVARFDAGVYITGETGTGKELAARSIHYLGNRRNRPFIPVNCGSFNDDLLISELFGHEEGAFTGAKYQHIGLIEQANMGTLFLDEIDSLSNKAQVSLLRFLQDQKIRGLGSKSSKQVDVRIISASNSDLHQSMDRQAFREDLYYRLDVLRIHLPPLRHRRDDIPLLAQHFINTTETQYKLRDKSIHPETMIRLEKYHWPGNVRELENYIRRACLMSDDPIIKHIDHIDPISSFTPLDHQTDTSCYLANFNYEKQKVISHFEKAYLTHVMERYRGNVTQAAKYAAKERKSFYRLLKKHYLEKKQFLLGYPL